MKPSKAASLLAHESIRASAGSGKTYQLVIRYLRLIAAGAPPANILASTFTRLAAGEMRDRILMRLANAVDDEEKRKELERDLGAGALLKRQVQDMLAALTRQLHRMNVRTLDSFFAGVVRCFAIELNVPAAGDMMDETEAASLRAEALQLMLDENDAQKLIDILRLLTQGSSERSVMTAMDSVVSNLYELYREAGDEPWTTLPRQGKGDGLLSPAQVADAITALEEFSINPDRRQLTNGWTSDVERARARDWEAFVTNGIATKIASGATKYGQSAIPPEMAAAYMPLVNHARADVMNRMADQTAAMRDLLELFCEHYEGLKRRRGAMTFSDVTHAMGRAEELGTMQDIGFRLDGQLHHLLLDEFQDTSIPQWRALEPLAKEIVSNAPPERTFFCVGDVKQSIYSWRDAAPEVLDELPRLLRGDDGTTAITERSLAKSYRSSPVIMDAVNRVFESLTTNAALEAFPAAAAQWMTGFSLHATAKDKLNGFVQLWAVRRAKEDEKQSLVRLKTAADLIADLHRAQPNMEIAVLTRGNKTVARLMFELGRRDVMCSGRGGGPLTDAAAVNAVLDLLQLADHPDDTIAAFNVANSPLGKSIELNRHDDERARRRVAHRARAGLLADGLADTIARWATGILAHCDEREARRLMHLVDLAGQHENRATLRPSDFVDIVEVTNVADPQAARVQVMTIHQSKGLEFDAVVLPELDGKVCELAGRSGKVAFERESPTGRITRISRWMNEKVRAIYPADARMDEMFEGHRLRNVRENLCLLYVAMTRARQGLYMFMDPPAENERTIPKKLSSVLRSALATDRVEPDSIVFEAGDAQWMKLIKHGAAPEERSASMDGTKIPLRAAVSEREALLLRGRAAAAASAHVEAFGGVERLWIDHEAREQGTAIHALCESIDWLENSPLDEQALEAIVQAKMPRRNGKWAREQVTTFTALLKQPAIRQLFTTPASGKTIVHRELPFARVVDGQLQRGYIDRLTVSLDQHGQATAACVIDFKTNPLRNIAPEAAAQTYLPQLTVYADAVSQMFGVPAQRVTMQVAFVVAGVVVDISGRVR